MKLDKLLQDTIRIKLNPRKPIFFTRVKFFIFTSAAGEWIQNCNGLLILYQFNQCFYFTIMNMAQYRIDFDMEIYTNFLKFAKFLGENRSMQFLVPAEGINFIGMMILESKQQLTQLKRKLEECFYKGDNAEQIEFFKRPQVQQLIKEAEITEEALQTYMKLRNDAQAEIKNYFNQIDNLQKMKKNSGFKAYGLGREQWKLQQSEKQYLKQKKRADVVAYLTRLNKQARVM